MKHVGRWLALLAWCSGAGSLQAEAPFLVAHRGASHQAPENTLAAFRLAWEQGADAVEGDFHLTRDGHIVCLHDASTQRTTGRDLKVAEASLEELRQLEAGSWKGEAWRGEKIPTLGEVLATVPEGKRLFIEIKCGPEIVPFLVEALEPAALDSDQIVVISFQAEVVKAVKKALPHHKVFWLTGYKQDEKTGRWHPSLASILRTLRATRADGLDSLAHETVTAAMVRRLKEEGFQFHVWTVDDPELAERMMTMGAQSITTNRPRWLREALGRADRLPSEARPE